MNGQRKCGVHTHTCVYIYIYIYVYIYVMSDILLRHEKEWNAAICDNMNGSWGHSSKWNLSEKEGWILYDLLSMEYKK